MQSFARSTLVRFLQSTQMWRVRHVRAMTTAEKEIFYGNTTDNISLVAPRHARKISAPQGCLEENISIHIEYQTNGQLAKLSKNHRVSSPRCAYAITGIGTCTGSLVLRARSSYGAKPCATRIIRKNNCFSARMGELGQTKWIFDAMKFDNPSTFTIHLVPTARE